MGVEVAIEEQDRIVLVRLHGTVTFADFQDARVTVTTSPGWSPSFAHVLDFTGITQLALSHHDVERLARAEPIFAPDAPQILVARAGSVTFGLARMFQSYSEGRRLVQVVDSMERALAVLAARALHR